MALNWPPPNVRDSLEYRGMSPSPDQLDRSGKGGAMNTEQRSQENWRRVRSFVMASKPNAQTFLRKLQQERSATDEGAVPWIEATAHEALVLHVEAMAGLLEELAERVHLLRDELWQLRAELAQQGGDA